MRKSSVFAGSILACVVASAASAQTSNWTGGYLGVMAGLSDAKPYGYYHGYYYTAPNPGAGATAPATGPSTGPTTGYGGATPPGTTVTPPTAGATPAGYISYNIDRAFTDFAFAGFGGYNWQADRWVFGLEGDYGYIGGSGGATVMDPGGSGRYDKVRFDSGGHLRARAGYDLGAWLPYFTAGGVFDEVYAAHFGVSPTSNGAAQLFQNTNMRVGWSIGVGVDYALGNGWTTRAEYTRDYLGKYTSQWVQDQLYSYTSFNIDVFRVGLSHRF